MKCPRCEFEYVPQKFNVQQVKAIVMAWKVQTGVKREDKVWDKIYFPRFMKQARELLALFGNWRDAVDCIQYIHEKMTDKGLDCNLNTVVNHAQEYREILRSRVEDRKEKDGVIPFKSVANKLSG